MEEFYMIRRLEKAELYKGADDVTTFSKDQQ